MDAVEMNIPMFFNGLHIEKALENNTPLSHYQFQVAWGDAGHGFHRKKEKGFPGCGCSNAPNVLVFDMTVTGDLLMFVCESSLFWGPAQYTVCWLNIRKAINHKWYEPYFNQKW